jgi:putative transposase
MARKLRIQYPGALYHVINHGNYRRDVFETAGAARAFEECLWKSCEIHQWVLHAHVVMKNHFHLALETPNANLVEGMHWLLGTFSTPF